MKIENERYWNLPWSLVEGCSPCSPCCEHCWSAAMAHRFYKSYHKNGEDISFTDLHGKFNGHIMTRPDRLDIPRRRKKPTVWAVWNDLFHEDVPQWFVRQVYDTMLHASTPHAAWHTYLILTKRPHRMADFVGDGAMPGNIYHGLTVCNQQEWDEKKKYFYMIPGKKFLSLEPLLGAIDLELTKIIKEPFFGWPDSEMQYMAKIDAVILGGETGPGARPMHPDWVRSVRDQCQAAGVPFFFKQWGEWRGNYPGDSWEPTDGMKFYYFTDPQYLGKVWRCGKNKAGRLLDGKEWSQLPWIK